MAPQRQAAVVLISIPNSSGLRSTYARWGWRSRNAAQLTHRRAGHFSPRLADMGSSDAGSQPGTMLRA
eukprot:1817400-Pleurochrysis_carterae.AAC.2